MKKYKCIKEVEAEKILTIKSVDNGFIINDTIEVSNDYVNKHKPYEGGYYVVYKDGYKSFSPAEAFEEGYIEV